jgi:hypothetical protein
MIKRLKPKRCKACGIEFTPFDGFQRVCCPVPCGLEWARSERERKERQRAAKQLQADRTRIKPKAKWLKEAQTEFNRFIRLRDASAKLPCISCQRHHKGQYHAGHYLAVGMGGASPLRFTEDNCHRQCSVCNNHLSSNAIMYRINLVKKIGLERVEWLEGPHPALKLTIDDIEAIKLKYAAKANALAKELDNYSR